MGSITAKTMMLIEQPCIIQPWWMSYLHEFLGAGVLMTLGGVGLMIRMMWGDYRKRHRINGDS